MKGKTSQTMETKKSKRPRRNSQTTDMDEAASMRASSSQMVRWPALIPARAESLSEMVVPPGQQTPLLSHPERKAGMF